MKNLKNIAQLIIISLIIFFAITILSKASEKSILKKDSVELSNIKYGLLNADAWKNIIVEVTINRVEELDIEDFDDGNIENEIQEFLNERIEEFESEYRSNQGFLRNLGADMFGIFNELKEQSPQITASILVYLNDSDNTNKVKEMIITKIKDYAAETFSKVNYSKQNQIIERYGQQNSDATVSFLLEEQNKISAENNWRKGMLIGLFGLLLLYILFFKNLGTNDFFFIVLCSFIFLLVGLFLPMIELDARIESISIELLGEAVDFKNQIVYYKSKSIIDVVQMMLLNGKLELILVGVLILLFSVVFPMAKLIATITHLYLKRWRENKIINFLVFKSGKWSMADVMVVAIFMSYLGFSGVLTEQMAQLESTSDNFDVITTNNSDLLFGFYAFFAFVLLSLFLSQRMKRSISKDDLID